MKEKICFKGRLLKLYEQQRTLPNGHAVRLEVIKHPGAVLIVPFVSAKEIVLLRQYRPVIDATIYELPAGTRGPREPHMRCAHRELKEETGFTAGSMRRIGAIYPAPGYTTEKIVIFRADKLTPGVFRPEADEVITAAVYSLARVRALFKSGAIVDAKTICALAMCRVLA